MAQNWELTGAKKIWRSQYFKSAISIVIIVMVILGFFLGLRFALNTDVPTRVVESSSMSIPHNFQPGPPYPFSYILLTLLRPFDRTLNVGDIIIIQGIKPTDLKTNYPNSDIIVYKNPTDPTGTPIVHRIVASYEVNGTLYFQTKGDGNTDVQWPKIPSVSEYDSNTIWHTGEGVPQNLVIGKVVMRIPWFGWITLELRDNALVLPLIVAIILIFIALEFIIPVVRKRQKKLEQEQTKNEDTDALTQVEKK
jgi:hypothetical protein